MTTLSELCEREVINMKTGANLGRVDDLQIEETGARVEALVIYGRLRWFGLLGREESLVIPWRDIVSIGADVILVQSDLPLREEKIKKLLIF